MLGGRRMSERVFLVPEAKERTRETIKAIELRTSAEVIVAMRRRAARHFGVSALFGAGFALVVLVVMLVSPTTYDVRTMPLDVLLAFALAFGFAQWTEIVRRRLSPPSWLERATRGAAGNAFQELSMAKTAGRTGILVFVALLERRVAIVADEGVPVRAIATELETTRLALETAVRQLSFAEFERALLGLSAPLERALPRGLADVNELSDEVA
jgi:putative membrane protein